MVPEAVRDLITLHQTPGTRVSVGGVPVKLHAGFRLYLASDAPNPTRLHAESAVSARLGVISFHATASGLVEHLLAAVVAHERP